jgi:hypothetical protein
MHSQLYGAPRSVECEDLEPVQGKEASIEEFQICLCQEKREQKPGTFIS